MRLLWSEEFDGPAGILPDPRNFWPLPDQAYAGELELNTARPRNVGLDGLGCLRITACRESITVPEGTFGYTSARLVTRGTRRLSPPCRIETRLRAPNTPGLNAGFWLLDEESGAEIDIAEFHAPWGDRQLNLGIHGPNAAFTIPTPRLRLPYTSDWHTYSLDWSRDAVAWSVDGVLMQSLTREQFERLGGDWSPFMSEDFFYLILSITVGAVWEGPPTAESEWPQSMLVDWVRVWA